SPNEDLPERGDKLRRGDEEVGELRSWTISPTLERPLAFAIVRTAKVTSDAVLDVREGARVLTAKPVATPVTAPGT
ncbi:MAG TPA: glycine cleavage T C-terminal barrel domain-containing protein, partial [Planctomycetota bacterium]|nr:glycine cleavage T C-terminal barrel domain-containing protein [Planctomycetota bacterium]